MNEIENCSQNLSAMVKRLKSRIKGKILIIKAVTLTAICEGTKYKLRNAKELRILPPDFINEYILGKIGLEIGGPSQIFSGKGIIPLYDTAESIDNINYSDVTIWDSQYKAKLVAFKKSIIAEASNLSIIESSSYDFVASSNVIEHLSNPLLALLEMKRVVRPGGLIIAIVPHKDIIFDHKRPVTSINSLIEIFNLAPSEGEISHLDLDEIFKDYDLDLDPPAGNIDSFKKRTLDNKSNRALHQTVFNTQLLLEMFNWADIKILFVKTSLILSYILVIGAKSDDSKDVIQKSNVRYIAPNADWRNDTIFKSERTRKYSYYITRD